MPTQNEYRCPKLICNITNLIGSVILHYHYTEEEHYEMNTIFQISMSIFTLPLNVVFAYLIDISLYDTQNIASVTI